MVKIIKIIWELLKDFIPIIIRKSTIDTIKDIFKGWK